MSAIRHILCPIDFSECSTRALAYAAAISRYLDVPLTVLHVVPPPPPIVAAPEIMALPPYVYTDDDLEMIRAEARSCADAVASRAAVRVFEGRVLPTIVDEAERIEGTLLVMGTHGRSRFGQLVLGSVVERVLANTRVPVIAVPRAATPAAATGEPFRRVICAVDFSPASSAAVAMAASLARTGGDPLALLSVVEPTPQLEPSLIVSAARSGADLAADRATRTRLHAWVPSAVAEREPRELVTLGTAHHEIVAVAREQGADLIVMGRHGGSAMTIGVGSTTHHVIRDAACPVLSVRAEEA